MDEDDTPDTRSTADEASAGRFASFVAAVEGCVGGHPLADGERGEAERWHRLGAPTAHVAVVIRNDRQNAAARSELRREPDGPANG